MTAGSNQLAIGVSLLMRDGFTSQAMHARNAMNALHTTGDKLARQQAVLARNSNAAGAAIGVGLISGMAHMYKKSAEFGYVMKYVSLNSDATGRSFDRLSDKALEVGKRTMFSSIEIANGMKYLAQAGLSAEQITSTIDSAANLAQATMSDLPMAADLMNRMASAFKIDKNLENMARIGDVIGAAANKSETNLDDMGEAMKYSQLTAARLGMTLEETSASLMVLAGVGARGSMGGTALENMTRELAKAGGGGSKKKNNALGLLGMTTEDIRDANGNLVPFSIILEKIGKGLEGMGKVDAQNALSDLLNVRAARASDLVTQLPKYIGYLDELNNSKGFTGKMAADMMDSDQGRIDVMMSNWEALKIQMGGIFATVFTPLVRGLTFVMDVVGKLFGTGLGKAIGAMIAGFIMIKTAAMGYRAIVLSLRLLQGGMGTSMMGTGTSIVSTYGRMTTAAATYGATARAANMYAMGTSSPLTRGMRPDMRYAINRQNMFNHYTPNMTGAMIAGSRFSGVSNFIGKASPYAMVGGMGLSALGSSMGEDSKVGKGLDVAGSALGMAGTGAMIGSMIAPGIGTTVGAVVGGVGSLLYSLYDSLKEVEGEVDKATAEAKMSDSKWREQAKIYQRLNWKDQAYKDYYNTSINGEQIKLAGGGTPQRNDLGNSTTVIFQMDGIEKMKKTTTDLYVKEMINLGF